MDNGLLKISFDKNTKLWSVYEFEANQWAPVIINATSTLSFRDADSIVFSQLQGEVVTKMLTFDDSLGKGKRLELRGSNAVSEWIVTFRLYNERKTIVCSSTITNRSSTDWRTKEFRLIDLYGAAYIQYATDNVLMHNNGYQSWSNSEVVALDSVNTVSSYWSTVFYEPEAWRSVLFGFLTNTRATNGIRSLSFFHSTGTQKLQTFSDVKTVIIPPGKTIEFDPAYISFDQSPHDNLQRFSEYQQTLAPAFNKPFTPTGKQSAAFFGNQNVPTGWCSWYYYYQHISEDSIIHNLNTAAKHLKKAGLQYIQIDDGFQIAAGDWNTNKQFPHGHKWLTDQIHAKGFLAGLWIAPFAVAESSSVYKDHRDWLLRDENDSLKQFFANDWWGGKIYALDPSIPAVQVWLENLFYTITAKWGYDYVKIDFLYFAGEGGKYHQPVSSAQAYQMGLRAIRKGVGSDKFILGCGAPMGSSVGFVDGMRIGQDVYAGWNGITPGVNAAAQRYFYHNNAWYNDPDCLLVREPLTRDQARAWSSVVALSGQMNLLSDKLPALSQDRIDLLKTTIPSYGKSATPVDLFTVSENNGLSLRSSDNQQSIQLPGTWKFSVGDAMEWKEPAINDGNWKEIPVPARWENVGYPDVDSIVWYRTTFTIPNDWPHGDVTLSLGKIDDCDQTFVNGNLVGKTGTFPPEYNSEWTAFRVYTIPQHLIKWGEENSIAIRVYDGGGPGGWYSIRDLYLPSVWNLKVDKQFDQWNVAGVFNWTNNEQRVSVQLDQLGLSPRKTYLAYEFWNDRFLGEIKGAVTVLLPPTSSNILSIHEKGNVPVILSTSRHITQGAIDLADVRWNAKKKTLSASSGKLIDGTYTVVLYVPEGLKVKSIRVPVRHTMEETSDGIVRIHFEGNRGGKLAWQAVFE
jgi:hypothetical protein